MNILYPKAIAGSKYCAGVLRLVNVFKKEGKVSSPYGSDLVKKLESSRRNKLREVFDECFHKKKGSARHSPTMLKLRYFTLLVSSVPALNLTTFLAAILIGVPV